MTAISAQYHAAREKDAAARLRFEALDSWRGLCALLVAIYHFQASGFLPANAFLQGGYLFVDFFFVLSGFVIAHAYGHRLEDGRCFRQFVLTRFGRLFPLHLFMLGVFVLFELLCLAVPSLNASEPAFEGAHSITALISNLLLLQGLGFGEGLTWNSPSWSISTEFFAYLLFGALTLGLRRNALLAFASAVIVAPFFIAVVSPDYMDTTWDYGFIRCLFGFSAGVLVQTLFAKAQPSVEVVQESIAAWTFAELATVIAVVIYVASGHEGPISVAAPLMFAFAVFVFAHEAGHISRLLTGPMFLRLGALSYSIYMTHLFVQSRMINLSHLLTRLTGAELLQQDGMSAASAAVATLAMLIVTILVSALTYRFIEIPGRDWFRSVAKRMQ